jgi:hypothetical protein
LSLLVSVLFPKYKKNQLISKNHSAKLKIKKVLPNTKRECARGGYIAKNANLPHLYTNVPTLNTNVPTLNANVPTLNANVAKLNANVPTLNANLPIFN